MLIPNVDIVACHSWFSFQVGLLWTGLWRSEMPILYWWHRFWQLYAKEIPLFGEKSSVFSLKRDHDYYYYQATATNPHYWQWLLRFCLGCSEGQVTLYEGFCHDAIHDWIELRSKQEVYACKESQEKLNGSDCGAVICHTLCFKPHIQKWHQYYIPKTNVPWSNEIIKVW